MSLHTFSTTLPHLVPARPLVTLSHTALRISSRWQPLFWHVRYFILPFQLSHVSLCFIWAHIPNSALEYWCITRRTSFEHPSTFFAAAICSAPSCFTSFAFPSYTCAYSSFGTITFIRIRPLILVSRCESVRIASILPTTCASPFPTYFAMCIPIQSSILRSLRRGTYTGLRSVIHLFPNPVRKLPVSPYLRDIQLLLLRIFFIRCHSPFPSIL